MDVTRRSFMAGLTAALAGAPANQFSKLFPVTSSLHSLEPASLPKLLDAVRALVSYTCIRPDPLAFHEDLTLGADEGDMEWFMNFQSAEGMAVAFDDITKLVNSNPHFNVQWIMELLNDPKALQMIGNALTNLEKSSPTSRTFFWNNDTLSIGEYFVRNVNILKDQQPHIDLFRDCRTLDEVATIMRERLIDCFEMLPPLKSPLTLDPILRQYPRFQQKAAPALQDILDNPPASIRGSLANLKASFQIPETAAESTAQPTAEETTTQLTTRSASGLPYKFLDTMIAKQNRDGKFTTELRRAGVDDGPGVIAR